MDFLREFGGHLWVTFWELLAVTGRLLGVLKVVPGASGSGQNLFGHPAIRCRLFFFEQLLEQRNGAQVEETRKKTSEKVILR